MKNRQSAKVRGVLKDLAREKHLHLTTALRLNALAVFVADDAAAASYQTLGQYRSALLKLINPQDEKP